MAFISPLLRLHHEAEASLTAYGSALPPAPGLEPVQVQIVESFGELDLEYAALRKGCILIDQPHRATIEVTGADRIPFLNRMVTQELADLSPFRVKRSFWLNKKGRIDADLRIIDLPHATFLDLDVHALHRTIETLSAYIVTEDVRLRDATEDFHRLAVHGPTAFNLLSPVALFTAGAEASGPVMRDLAQDQACVVSMAAHETVVFRDDSTGEVGLELIVPAAACLALYTEFLELGQEPETAPGTPGAAHRKRDDIEALGKLLAARIRLRPAGWHAFNIARLEAGTPLYNVDFGPDSLPAETGVLLDRVHFKKGCYLGQEVVARMHARKQARQHLVAVRFESLHDDAGVPRQPVTASPIFPGHSAEGVEPIGVVTSSAVSPMLGGVPIAFAQLKGAAAPGQEVCTIVGSQTLRGTIQPQLRFWSRQ